MLRAPKEFKILPPLPPTASYCIKKAIYRFVTYFTLITCSIIVNNYIITYNLQYPSLSQKIYYALHSFYCNNVDRRNINPSCNFT